ncbi:hypothetical protein BRD18_08750 [Halobacteriales archaeon SW_7_71_33]|nr:MAG: hypothetical protein BRD18_08750 [Halobacteriales archaeon SW_7_71_33]
MDEMRAPAAVVTVVVAVVLGGVVLPAAAAVGSFGAVGDGVGVDLVGDVEPAGDAEPADATATGVHQSDDGNVSPGQRLAGVVGVQGEEVGSEVSERRFAVRFEAAASNESRAAIVAEEVETLRDRLDRLRTQRDTLRAAVQNGSITPGEFRARTAVLAANISSTQRMLNNSALAAASLPEERLTENGLNVSRVERLRRNASELGGPEIAEIARDIAGPETGREAGPPEDRGPPEGIPGNVSDAGPPEGVGPPDSNGSEVGPPEDAGQPDGNESEVGPPEGVGPPDGNESEVGPPEDAGQPGGNESNARRPEDTGPPDGNESEAGPPEDGANPPEDTGPPGGNESDAGPPENTGPPDGNESDSGTLGDTGPPEDAGPSDGNESEAGPPGDAGGGGESGTPDDAGAGDEDGDGGG